jgi:hypothetical protein
MPDYEKIDVNVFYLHNKSNDSYLGVDEDDNLTWMPSDNSVEGSMIHVSDEIVNAIISDYTDIGQCYSDAHLEFIDEDDEDDDYDENQFLIFSHRLGKFINDDIADVVFMPIEIFFRESGVNFRYNNLSVISSANNFTIYQKIMGEYFTATE